MNLKERLINALGGEVKTTNTVSGNDFLKYGSRGRGYINPDWKEVKMDDEDIYRGYPYAVIQKRANKVATLAKENLQTWAKPEVVDLWQKHDQDPLHPYLKLIEDSEDFSVKQFWKTICIYLDLAGAFYLAAIRTGRVSTNPNYPSVFSDIQKFILLNPYEIKRVLNKDGQLAGYIERKKDGRYREWPVHMIIPMRELNPFDSNKVWSMTDASKEATFTLSQSGSYTRESLNGNLNAPGILSTDVILEDNLFADFRERVVNHTKGEPLFGNGTGAITWTSMQQDLDKAALLDINEINRTTLFAVSGTSKTSLGIEQSGTTRETARVQTEQFIADTAQPRLEDIIDYLNLDYKRYYKTEYDKTGYWIEIKSAASRDYATETQATQMRQAQSELAFQLMQKGYTMQSSYDYAEGKIELSDLELEKGLDKPQNDNPENGGDTPPENTPSGAPESRITSDSPEDDSDTVSDEETPQNANNELQEALIEREGLEPHKGLKVNSSEEAHDHTNCDCGKIEVLVNELGETNGKTLDETYHKFLEDIEEVQKETYKACVSKLSRNAFEESDIIGKRKKEALTKQLKQIIQNYWWILTPLMANSVLDDRNLEYGENVKFVFTNALQKKVEDNALRVSEGHMETILDDVLEASNKAYTEITEEAAAKLIIKAYKDNEAKYKKWFEEQPSMNEALKAIRNTDILEENRKIYERANELAIQGYKREDIIKKIREEYNHLSEKRADLIARNETSRAYGHAQYEADTQFLNSIGQLDTAYKQWYSRRPENEKDKICPFCQAMIDKGPIPFTENFISLGDTLTVERDGKVYNWVCNYENIESSTLHPNCLCSYHLILNGKTLNEADTNRADDNVALTDDVDNSAGESKTVNGGKGSGNFGHAGRPGLVGGSASSDIANPEQKVTADWLDKHREFAKVKGFTDEWIDQSVKDLRRRELKEKALKTKTTKQFDKVWEEMQKEGQDYSVWYETVGKAHREHIAKLEELRSGFDKKEQKQAVDDLEATGVILRNGDKKWLEEQCPAELINGITSGLKEAGEKGLNLEETQVIMSAATRKGGSCTFDPVNKEVKIFLTRDWMNNADAMREKAKTKGPDGSKWWTNGKTNTNVTHECGHAYIWQIVKNQNLNPFRYERLCEKIASEARDIFARDSGQDYWASRGELSRNEDCKFLSQYGRKNDMECIAESCNNPDYSRFTKIVNDLVIKGLKGEKTWQI